MRSVRGRYAFHTRLVRLTPTSCPAPGARCPGALLWSGGTGVSVTVASIWAGVLVCRFVRQRAVVRFRGIGVEVLLTGTTHLDISVSAGQRAWTLPSSGGLALASPPCAPGRIPTQKRGPRPNLACIRSSEDGESAGSINDPSHTPWGPVHRRRQRSVTGRLEVQSDAEVVPLSKVRPCTVREWWTVLRKRTLVARPARRKTLVCWLALAGEMDSRRASSLVVPPCTSSASSAARVDPSQRGQRLVRLRGLRRRPNAAEGGRVPRDGIDEQSRFVTLRHEQCRFPTAEQRGRQHKTATRECDLSVL